MALDRQSIEKRDFPLGERGYEPAAVDAHLAEVAAELEEFKRIAGSRSESLAASASGRVHSIIEAAENSAAEIQRTAEDEARTIREQATRGADTARDQAAEQAREYLARVSEATNAMMQRLGSMEQELGALVEALRAGSSRLRADVQQLETDLGRVREVIMPPPGAEPAGATAGAAGWPAGAGSEPAGAGSEPAPFSPAPSAPAASEPPVPEAAEFAEVVGADESSVASSDDGTDDAEGARLIALNMALNGTPREETARYLSENFHLADARGLLDEVYASVEG